MTGRTIHFHLLDLAKEYERLKRWLAEQRPDAIIHFAEQRAAPYSMKTDRHKVYTVNNNVNATHNLLAALVETGIDAHLVHLGHDGRLRLFQRRAQRSPRAISTSRSRRRAARRRSRRSFIRRGPARSIT